MTDPNRWASEWSPDAAWDLRILESAYVLRRKERINGNKWSTLMYLDKEGRRHHVAGR